MAKATATPSMETVTATATATATADPRTTIPKGVIVARRGRPSDGRGIAAVTTMTMGGPGNDATATETGDGIQRNGDDDGRPQRR